MVYVNKHEDFEQLLEESKTHPVVIFKHSTQCDISGAVYDEVNRFLASTTDVTGALVFVIERRDVSDAIADSLGIRHASPQVIVIKNGKPKWSASHWSITAAALSQAIYAEPSNQ
jgi:bacillithiol system protein YtxJ